MVQSGGKTACYISDLISTSAHLDLNSVMSYDLYPLETIESRKRYYAGGPAGEVADHFTHYCEIAVGLCAKDEKGKMAVAE